MTAQSGGNVDLAADERRGRADLVPLMDHRQRVLHSAGAACWVVAMAVFWSWWLSPDHSAGVVRFALNTLVLAWLTILPLYFVFMFLRARVVRGPVALPAGCRVAMVVTKAPSEPFAVVRKTLEAMLAQDHPHDTWLADEDPSPQILAWCAANGVQVSTRKGVADYHRACWPRRTRCKEGNLAYFYDRFGYERYDFVSQLDADHVPEPGYLREMLKPFVDPAVGYVSAPSICDKNAAESWSARGRVNIEATLHGLLQAGYSAGWAPLCIGSHYAVRTKALREIGGLGPELAEDHSTTLMMNAHGWKGVHAFDAIAHGDGPRTFPDLITQEFQWSRSLVTILLCYSPTYVPRLRPRLRFQFLFCQLWYPLFALFMLLLYLMPIIALATASPFVYVTFLDFYLHLIWAEIILVLLAWRWQANGWCRPANAKIISWEATLFLFARWPWVLLGTVAAFRDWWRGSFVDFRVTPKGGAARADSLPARVLAPYVALSAISGLAALLFSDVELARGFYFFAIINCMIYAALFAVITVQHVRENGIDCGAAPWSTFTASATLASLLVLSTSTIAVRGPDTIDALTWGSDELRVTRTTYSASGAGMRGDRIRDVRLVLPWRSKD